MATANVIELETCLKECLAYCDQHPEQSFVKHFHPRLKAVHKKWENALRDSQHHYLEWHREMRQDRLAWKHLGGQLRTTQNDLRKMNAIGYPEATIYHWDEEILGALAQEMIDYLRSHADDIEEGADRADNLQRMLDAARGEGSEQEAALDEFKRHVLFRANALGTLSATLADFRGSMRRALGKRSDEYHSIRWPITLSPDEPVLRAKLLRPDRDTH